MPRRRDVERMAADARIANMLRRNPGKPFSASEIAETTGLSSRTIQRAEKSALQKLRRFHGGTLSEFIETICDETK